MEEAGDDRPHLRARDTLRVPEAAPLARLLDPDHRLPRVLLPDLRAELRNETGGGTCLARHVPDRDVRRLRSDRSVALLPRRRRGYRARPGMDAPEARHADAAHGVLHGETSDEPHVFCRDRRAALGAGIRI